MERLSLSCFSSRALRFEQSLRLLETLRFLAYGVRLGFDLLDFDRDRTEGLGSRSLSCRSLEVPQVSLETLL